MKAEKTGKRELILEAALALFIANGYPSTRIIDIANAAGVGKGTVYEYFKSKEDLFFQLFDGHVVTYYYDRFEEIIGDQAIGAEEKLRRCVEFELESAAAFGKGMKLLNQFLADTNCFHSPHVQASLRYFMSFRFSKLLDIVEEGADSGEFTVDSPSMAATVLAGAISFYISSIYDPISMGLEACEGDIETNWNQEDFLTLLLQGLKK